MTTSEIDACSCASRGKPHDQRKARNSISQESWVMFMILTDPRKFNSNVREQSIRIKSIDEKPIQVVVDRELCFTI